MNAVAERVLDVEGLRVGFRTREGRDFYPVDDVSFSVARAGVTGLVGESGCGKSMTALAILGLVPAPGRIESGRVTLNGRELRTLAAGEMRKARGLEIGMVFQEPMTSLNPVFTIGYQIAETIAEHHGVGKDAARKRALELLELVQMPDARRRIDEYPHTLSGGMRQRTMIAIALACEPSLLIADEPTTALDVTVQAQLIELLMSLKTDLAMGILLITHDFGLVREMCDETVVMYAGRVAEAGATTSVLEAPQHPYAEGLLAAIPRLAAVKGSRLGVIPGSVPAAGTQITGCRFAPRCEYAFDRCATEPPLFDIRDGRLVRCWLNEDGLRAVKARPLPVHRRISEGRAGRPLLEARGLVVGFPVRSRMLRRTVGLVRAVDDVDLEIASGETLALVGESGCGKTTLGRALLRLIEASEGELTLNGRDITKIRGRALRKARSEMQMVFQDPFGSLNPRMTVGDIVREGLRVHKIAERRDTRRLVREVLERVGLDAHSANRYPHEFSGGQRQRIGIARALVVRPKLIVADEPVSALDASVQAQILNLLADLQDEFGFSYIFISHNLAAVAHLSDRIAVMYLGKVVEVGEVERITRSPAHPYTQALLSAVLDVDDVGPRNRIVLKGDVPSPVQPPSGCRFRTRCFLAQELGEENGLCAREVPPLTKLSSNQAVACHFTDEAIAARVQRLAHERLDETTTTSVTPPRAFVQDV